MGNCLIVIFTLSFFCVWKGGCALPGYRKLDFEFKIKSNDKHKHKDPYIPYIYNSNVSHKQTRPQMHLIYFWTARRPISSFCRITGSCMSTVILSCWNDISKCIDFAIYVSLFRTTKDEKSFAVRSFQVQHRYVCNAVLWLKRSTT